MTSNNINKIVQSNINLKPWMLSKNTNEIVNTYIQKIYKQMPTSFRKDIKTVRVATHKPENRGPLSTLKNLERQLPSAFITPRIGTANKSSNKIKPQNNALVNSLKLSNKNNQQMAAKLVGSNLTASKRVLKTPNYKIYKSQRYGSSSNSSRSSLLKRYDDRRHQRLSPPAQINYLIRSFHTSHFDPTYARYLMPARNQHVEANLGSIPDAVKFSCNIIKDLMTVDKFSTNKIANQRGNAKSAELTADAGNYPSLLSKYAIQSRPDSAIKNVKLSAERNMKKAKLSPEHRDYARINGSRIAQLKHPKPPNELFTAQHDRNNTELHEKHRRNRMKKLGLILPSPVSEKKKETGITIKEKGKEIKNENESRQFTAQAKNAIKQAAKDTITRSQQRDYKPDFPANTSQIKDKKQSILMPSPDLSFANCAVLPKDSFFIPKDYTTISPLVAARAQMPHKNNVRSYRYNRSDFFSTNKY